MSKATYTGGVAVDLFLPSGVRTVAPGDELADLSSDDTAALTARPDFDVATATAKRRKANTTADDAVQED